jgi:disulfide bond formation protein DsbB
MGEKYFSHLAYLYNHSITDANCQIRNLCWDNGWKELHLYGVSAMTFWVELVFFILLFFVIIAFTSKARKNEAKREDALKQTLAGC